MFSPKTPIEVCPGYEDKKTNLDERMSPFKMTLHMWRSFKKIATMTFNNESNEKVCFKSIKLIDADKLYLRSLNTQPSQLTSGNYYFVDGESLHLNSILYKDDNPSSKDDSIKALSKIEGKGYPLGKYVGQKGNSYVFECDLGTYKTRTDWKGSGVITHTFKSVVVLESIEGLTFHEVVDIPQASTTAGGTRYKRKSIKKRSFRKKTRKQTKTNKTK